MSAHSAAEEPLPTVAGVRVGDVMTRRPAVAAPEATVAHGLEIMRQNGISSLLILPPPGTTAYGIVTMRDIVTRVVGEDLDTEATRLGDIATWRLINAQPSWSLQEAAELMSRARVRRLPVVEGAEVVGLISDTDIFIRLAPEQDWEHVRSVRKERALRRASEGGPVRRVGELASAPVLTTAPAMAVTAAVTKMVAAGVSSLLVEDGAGADAQGIITKRDIVTRVVARGMDPAQARVGEVMSAPVQTIGPDATLEECSAAMARAGVRRFPVRREGRIEGIISDSDILAAVAGRRWFGHRRSPAAAIVADVMRTPERELQPVWTESVAPELSLWDCAARLAAAGLRELPVVQGGRIVGIVRDTDILRAVTERGGVG